MNNYPATTLDEKLTIVGVLVRGKKGVNRINLQWRERKGVLSYKGYSGKEGDKEGTFHVEIKPEPEVQGSRNSDLQFKSKAVQSSCKHLLSQGSLLPLARNHL